MAQTNEQSRILAVQTAAKLHLSQTEYKALETIAQVYGCTIDEVVNTIIHRSVHAELEITAPRSHLLSRLKEENDQVFEEAEAIEQKSKDSKYIEVTTTFEVDRVKYEKFRRIFDQQSWKEFVEWAAGHGLLDEVLGANPEIMQWFLEAQDERLHGKKKEA